MKIKLTLVDLHGTLVDAARKIGWNIDCLPYTDIRSIVPRPGMYFISPANSLGFMDGGIDYILSRVMFPDVESKVKAAYKSRGHTTLLGRPFLPIGQAVTVDTQYPGVHMIAAPTMWLPQDVRGTHNAYHAMYAILEEAYSHSHSQFAQAQAQTQEQTQAQAQAQAQPQAHTTREIVLCGLCTGCGMVNPVEAVQQMFDAYTDFQQGLEPKYSHETIVSEQPNVYMNTEFKRVDPAQIVDV